MCFVISLLHCRTSMQCIAHSLYIFIIWDNLNVIWWLKRECRNAVSRSILIQIRSSRVCAVIDLFSAFTGDSGKVMKYLAKKKYLRNVLFLLLTVSYVLFPSGVQQRWQFRSSHSRHCCGKRMIYLQMWHNCIQSILHGIVNYSTLQILQTSLCATCWKELGK